MDPVNVLLNSLTHDPDDDTAWLALADALEEKGDQRGEATRLSVWLRRGLDSPEHTRWECRLRELHDQGVGVCLPEKAIFLAKGVELRLVLVPPGTFRMGTPEGEKGDKDETPQHQVTLTKGFYLGVHQVTQSQWQAVGGSPSSAFVGENRPVEQVSWNDCREFCRKLGERDGKRYRLPSEAEWEYACRAGTTTEYCSGNGLEALRKVGWCSDERHYGSARATKPVGQLQSNAWGLFDMHGNVCEWCNEIGRDYTSASVTDPQGSPGKDKARVVRGGSWRCYPSGCRATYRNHFHRSSRQNITGCRVVLCLDG